MADIPTHYLGQKVSACNLKKLGKGVYLGTLSGKKEQDLSVYILARKSLSSAAFTGKCIAILRRQKEGINIPILSAESRELTNREIESQLHPKEHQYGHLLVRDRRVTRTHRGVYGVIIRQNKILVIRKARGPYTGLYDLPGGSPEANETPEQTVIREIKEETNCDVLTLSHQRTKEVVFSDFTKESGEKGVMQHFGILFDCIIKGTPSQKGDGLDSNGAVWIDKDQLSPENATPFVLMGIHG